MTFEAAAQPLQLVLDGKETNPHVSLVNTTLDKAPRSFETPKSWVPRLGSSTIVALAGAMYRQGAGLMRFDIRDLRLAPIDKQLADNISAELVDVLQAEGSAAATSLVDTKYRDYLINSIEVQVGKRRATLERQGIVFTSNRDGLRTLLQAVWREAVGG